MEGVSVWGVDSVRIDARNGALNPRAPVSPLSSTGGLHDDRARWRKRRRHRTCRNVDIGEHARHAIQAIVHAPETRASGRASCAPGLAKSVAAACADA